MLKQRSKDSRSPQISFLWRKLMQQFPVYASINFHSLMVSLWPFGCYVGICRKQDDVLFQGLNDSDSFKRRLNITFLVLIPKKGNKEPTRFFRCTNLLRIQTYQKRKKKKNLNQSTSSWEKAWLVGPQLGWKSAVNLPTCFHGGGQIVKSIQSSLQMEPKTQGKRSPMVGLF